MSWLLLGIDGDLQLANHTELEHSPRGIDETRITPGDLFDDDWENLWTDMGGEG